MKTLAILTNGGDTCALNASILSIRDSAYRVGYKKIYGVKRGYQGLLDWSLEDITRSAIDPRIGGSCLGSLRISPTRKVGQKKYEVDQVKCTRMAQTLADFNVDVLVVIGGDGTLQATQQFQEWVQAKRAQSQEKGPTFKLLGFLKTIDNDIKTGTFFQGTPVSLCPGFPSAVEKIVSTIEALRVTARTAERAFCVETMGREAGWLAAAGSFGGSEIVLIPELETFFTKEYPELAGDHVKLSNLIWERLARLLAKLYRRNRNVIVTIAEGFQPDFGDVEDALNFVKIIQNLYGDRKQVGATELVAMILSPVLDLYFSTLSRLDLNGLTPTGIRGQIQRAYAECPEKKRVNYTDNMSLGGHPLRGWNIVEKLAEDLMPDVDGPPAPHTQQSTTGLVNGGAEPPAAEISTRKEHQGEGQDWSRYRVSRPPYKFEIRPHRTDYVPRSGAPSAYDYRLATVLGWKIGEMLLDEQWGHVPRLKEVVPYEKLCIDLVEPSPIDEIRTLRFDDVDYFDIETLHVSDKITNFFRTITTGPENLETAITEVDALWRQLQRSK